MSRFPRAIALASLAWLTAFARLPAEDPPPIDTDRDGLPDTEEIRMGTRSNDPDTDGDGLLDGWEVNGYSSAGGYEPLPAYGASPLIPDVFVEVDWMTSAGASSQLNAIIAYQAAADVTRVFREAERQVRIHFDLGPRIEQEIPDALLEDVDFSAFQVEPDELKALPYQDSFAARPRFPAGSSTLLSLHEAMLGGRYFRPSRRHIFYYVLFVEQRVPAARGDDPREGSRHPYSEDFSDDQARRDGLRPSGIRASVIFRKPASDLPPEQLRYYYSATLLHELGHAFGLGHGGALPGGGWDSINWKPNYPSVMNYRFWGCGVDMAGGLPRMDFSHGRLPIPLHEASLLEAVGVGREPTDHLVKCIGVQRLDVPGLPNSLDWNKDGQLAGSFVAVDLNENGVLDPAPFHDHDDWGLLVRRGGDGIGLNAHGGCGPTCARGEDLVSLPGDFDGDGAMELLLRRGDRLTWASTGGTLELETPPERLVLETLGGWQLSAADLLQVGDFLEAGRDMAFLHRGREVALLDALGPAPRIAWLEDDRIPGAGEEPTLSWPLGPGDRFLAARLTSPARSDLAVAGAGDIGLLSLEPGPPARLALSWVAGIDLHGWTRGETPALLRGRALAGGLETLFVSSATSLTEIAGPASRPRVSRLDVEGKIPALAPEIDAWPLSVHDRLYPADLDGDGTDELVVHGPARLGVISWQGSDTPRVAWQATGTLQELWTFSDDPDEEQIHAAQLVAGGGEELLLSNGSSFAVLSWRAEPPALEVLDLAAGEVPGESLDTPTWQLAPGQRVLLGRFLPGAADTVLVQGSLAWGLLRFEEAGLRSVHRVSAALGKWLLAPEDHLLPLDLDGDGELELVLRNEDLFGVADVGQLPRLTFFERLDLESLELRSIPRFRRGDANEDGDVDISDVVRVLGFLFLGFPAPPCLDAADADDDGELNVSDPIRVLSYLFSGGAFLPPPGPRELGIDPTPDALTCRE